MTVTMLHKLQTHWVGTPFCPKHMYVLTVVWDKRAGPVLMLLMRHSIQFKFKILSVVAIITIKQTFFFAHTSSATLTI